MRDFTGVTVHDQDREGNLLIRIVRSDATVAWLVSPVDGPSEPYETEDDARTALWARTSIPAAPLPREVRDTHAPRGRLHERTTAPPRRCDPRRCDDDQRRTVLLPWEIDW